MLEQLQNTTLTNVCLFSVDFLLTFRLFHVDVCYVHGRQYIHIISAVCLYHRECSQEPAQARSMLPDSSTTQAVPLIISSHLLNIPLIVSWMNVIICNRTCAVIHNTTIISKLDLNKCLSIFCRFSVNVLSVFCGCFVYSASMLALFTVDILPAICP